MHSIIYYGNINKDTTTISFPSAYNHLIMYVRIYIYTHIYIYIHEDKDLVPSPATAAPLASGPLSRINRHHWPDFKQVNSLHICIFSKTSVNRPTMGPTLNGPLREVVGLGSLNIITIVLYV